MHSLSGVLYFFWVTKVDGGVSY